eukprot:9289518-Lingulodinium_polyedra.AAC.1
MQRRGRFDRPPPLRLSKRAPENWRAPGVRERAICEPLRPRAVDSTASLCRVCKMPHGDAVEWT